jgi:HD-GYP domain-containing protein (c-di-GMP phosphodiesterase class II)
MKNKLVLSLGALALVGGLTYTAQKVQAFGFGNGDHQNMASTLAEKLSKSEDDVQAAFDSIREDKRQQAETAFENRLTEAVQTGELTEDQKQLVVAKHQELRFQFESEQQQREQHRQELQTWADENGIDMSFLGGMGIGFGRVEGGKGMGRMGQ